MNLGSLKLALKLFVDEFASSQLIIYRTAKFILKTVEFTEAF